MTTEPAKRPRHVFGKGRTDHRDASPVEGSRPAEGKAAARSHKGRSSRRDTHVRWHDDQPQAGPPLADMRYSYPQHQWHPQDFAHPPVYPQPPPYYPPYGEASYPRPARHFN
jgi:hypothetical protein